MGTYVTECRKNLHVFTFYYPGLPLEVHSCGKSSMLVPKTLREKSSLLKKLKKCGNEASVPWTVQGEIPVIFLSFSPLQFHSEADLVEENA